MQKVTIEPGKNPPIVTVTAALLVQAFELANTDQSSESFNTFMVMVGHYANPERFPLPQSFAELGMVGPTEGLARFFEGNTGLTEETRKALLLLSDENNNGGNSLSAFLEVAKENFSQ